MVRANLQRGVSRYQSGVGLPRLGDHHRPDRDGSFQIGRGQRDRSLHDNKPSSRLPMGHPAQLHQRHPMVNTIAARRPDLNMACAGFAAPTVTSIVAATTRQRRATMPRGPALTEEATC
jgi:hypothetical protein